MDLLAKTMGSLFVGQPQQSHREPSIAITINNNQKIVRKQTQNNWPRKEQQFQGNNPNQNRNSGKPPQFHPPKNQQQSNNRNNNLNQNRNFGKPPGQSNPPKNRNSGKPAGQFAQQKTVVHVRVNVSPDTNTGTVRKPPTYQQSQKQYQQRQQKPHPGGRRF